MQTHENIKMLREKQGISQEELALKVGYKDRSSIAKVEAGKVDLTQSKIAAFASALYVTPAQLMGISDLDRTLPDNISPMPQMKRWKVLGGTACGEPIFKDLDEESVLAPEDIDADYVFRCVGDSMINARIFDGDIVFVKSDVEVLDGEIAVVRVDDEYTLKRIFRGPDYLELKPENPLYRTQRIYGDQVNAEIIGKAVHFLSRVR